MEPLRVTRPYSIEELLERSTKEIIERHQSHNQQTHGGVKGKGTGNKGSSAKVANQQAASAHTEAATLHTKANQTSLDGSAKAYKAADEATHAALRASEKTGNASAIYSAKGCQRDTE